MDTKDNFNSVDKWEKIRPICDKVWELIKHLNPRDIIDVFLYQIGAVAAGLDFTKYEGCGKEYLEHVIERLMEAQRKNFVKFMKELMFSKKH